MKVALVMYHFDASKGGMEAYVCNLSRQLLADGHEVHVYCGDLSTDATGIIFHYVPSLAFWYPLRDLTFAFNSARMLRSQSYDIIHGFSRTYYQDVFRIAGGCHAEYLRQTHPWVRTRWGRLLAALNPRDRTIIALEKKTFSKRNYARLTANSRITKQEIVDEFGVPPDDIVVIYNPVDAARFSPDRLAPLRNPTRERLGLGPGDIAVLFVGIGWARKGLQALIEGLTLVRRNDVKLVVVGSGDVQLYRRIALNAGLGGRIIFAGRSSRPEEYYAAADIFAFPTHHDAFPNVVLEAMASSLPVVCSALAGTAEIMTEGLDGLILSDPRDTSEIAARIRRLSDPDTRRSMGKAARLTAIRYTPEDNYRRTLAVYDEVIQIKRARRAPGGRTL